VTLLDVFEDEASVSLVFTRACGGELYDLLTDEGTDLMSERAAARLVRRLLQALSALHGAGIVHRDIKPENILLQHAGETLLTQEPLLIDFGLAAALPPGGAPLTRRAGTPLYLAPEVLAHRYGTAADVWSLGIVLFVMLARYPPFHGATEEAVFESVRRGQLLFAGAAWGRRSAAARRFVTRLLERNAAARPTAAAALRDEWILCEGAPEPPTATAAMIARLRRFAA
jgi:serine/threonine protein kinase